MMIKTVFVVLLACAAAGCATSPGGRSVPGETAAAITPADLRTRLYIFADDSMRGRAAGTVDNHRGAAYIEREVKRLGLEPGGENGTYFQDVPLGSRRIGGTSKLAVDERTFTLVDDYIPRDNGAGQRGIDGAAAIYGGTWGDSATLISPEAAAGKVVFLTLPSGYAVSRPATNRRFPGAAAIAVVALDRMPRDLRLSMLDESIGSPAVAGTQPPQVPSFLYSSERLARALFGASLSAIKPGTIGKAIRGQLGFESATPVPGRNVIAILRGSDPRFREQYVALGAHNDHDPVRKIPVDHDSVRAFNIVARPGGAESSNTEVTPAQWTRIRAILDSLRGLRPARIDSIMNGADDDGSGSMALLEIAESFAKAGVKPKRSLIFIWHTAEEVGLLGASYFTNNPTVPLDSIVAQINIDMIGRGGSADAVHPGGPKPSYGNPDFVEVIGARRLSTELGDIVDAANQRQPSPLGFSKVFDANGEPHQMYCRSDHYHYARNGIPIVFFFTSVHHDYHQVTDEPQYIDYPKYSRIVNLIRDIAGSVADLDHRVVVDKPKPNPRAACVQ
jgi:hypothetical protein